MNHHPDHEYRLSAGRFCLCVGLILLIAWPALSKAAERQSIYTWQDAEGRTHFADRPVTSFDVEDLNPRKPFGYIAPDVPEKAPTPTPSAKRQDPEAPTTGMAKTASLPTVVQETVPDYQRNCDSAKNRLNELGRFQRLKVKNAEGKMVFMTQMQKQVLIDEARAAVKDNCNRR
ncbi:DUF4124 domain-containing protein [Pseudomonadales bacterium]|nr:DUF4124 domain-containing protein [Pseudomonadales bacterium]MDB2509026.1 DUF4124 domain-containing protein [Pseudomonadales bacterium]